MFKINKAIAQVSTGVTLALVAASAASATGPIPTISIGTGASSNSLSGFLSGTVGYAITVILYVAAAIAVFYLIWAGIKYITAGGDTKKAGEARQAIINAVIGLIVIIVAFTIINFAITAGNSVNTNATNGTGNF